MSSNPSLLAIDNLLGHVPPACPPARPPLRSSLTNKKPILYPHDIEFEKKKLSQQSVPCFERSNTKVVGFPELGETVISTAKWGLCYSRISCLMMISCEIPLFFFFFFLFPPEPQERIDDKGFNFI